MNKLTCHLSIDKEYIDIAEDLCNKYNIDIEIDQRIIPNKHSGKRSFIIKARKDNSVIDVQEGSDINWDLDMLSKRLKLVLS